MPKSITEKLKQTAEQQRSDNEKRFKNAETELLRGKQKMIRTGFLMPEEDYLILQETIRRLAINEITASKTEVIRLALQALSQMSDRKLSSTFKGLKPVKRGRPI